MTDADCTPGREPRSEAASFNVILCFMDSVWYKWRWSWGKLSVLFNQLSFRESLHVWQTESAGFVEQVLHTGCSCSLIDSVRSLKAAVLQQRCYVIADYFSVWYMYCTNCLSLKISSRSQKPSTKFGQLIVRKIIKIVAIRCQILRLKCTKIDFGWETPLGS